jgi:fucokinase
MYIPPRPRIELILGDDAPSKEELVITELSQMEDYSQPHAPGALLKAAFICAGIIEFPSSKSLKNQLMEKFSSGFKLQSVSNVPKGSGLSLILTLLARKYLGNEKLGMGLHSRLKYAIDIAL